MKINIGKKLKSFIASLALVGAIGTATSLTSCQSVKDIKIVFNNEFNGEISCKNVGIRTDIAHIEDSDKINVECRGIHLANPDGSSIDDLMPCDFVFDYRGIISIGFTGEAGKAYENTPMIIMLEHRPYGSETNWISAKSPVMNITMTTWKCEANLSYTNEFKNDSTSNSIGHLILEDDSQPSSPYQISAPDLKRGILTQIWDESKKGWDLKIDDNPSASGTLNETFTIVVRRSTLITIFKSEDISILWRNA